MRMIYDSFFYIFLFFSIIIHPATPSTILGPFHTEDAPILNKGDNMVSLEKLAEGTPMLVRGFVRDLQVCVDGASLISQCNV